MDVQQILNNVARLSIGLDEPTSDDTGVYLEYLNLAHLELFRKTAAMNPLIAVVQKDGTTADGAGEIKLGVLPFEIVQVYNTTGARTLAHSSYGELRKRYPAWDAATSPQYWYVGPSSDGVGQSVRVYPKADGQTIRVLYTAQPALFTADTLEAAIPYPPAFHNVLVDGTCYYLFQGESAFKDAVKIQMAVDRWRVGQMALFNYLKGASGMKAYSTYSGEV